jgi:hypothetical protein
VVAIAAGTTAAALWLVLGTGWAVTAATAADYRDAGAERFLVVYGWEIGRLTVAPYLVMAAAVTIAGFRHRVFGTRFTVFGLIFTAVLVLGMFPSSPAGLLGMLATVWVSIAGLVLAFGEAPETDVPRNTPRRVAA